jgi:hypothetical protein
MSSPNRSNPETRGKRKPILSFGLQEKAKDETGVRQSALSLCQ